MALIHDVIDSDVRFIIDPITRTISNQGSSKLVLTRGDHNSERFTFEISRYVEGHDMSLCNVVRIHHVNTDSKTRETMADVYEPDDVSLCPDNDQLLIFSWLIPNTATNFAGNLAFAIEFQCVVDETVIYAWRTSANSTITIIEGINNLDSVGAVASELPTDVYPTIQTASSVPMIHDVIDSDVRFAIDPITRAISNKDSGKLMLVKGDHNSERFTFEIPRHVEGHDISLCNVVRIHYTNTDSKTRATSSDIYEPDDLCVFKEDENLVIFTWLISRNATMYAGSLAFTIEFQCVKDGEILYAWHTGINNTISISDGISNSESIVGIYSDILANWWHRVYADSTLPIEVHTKESFEALNGETKENTLYLLQDDPMVEQLLQFVDPLKVLDTLVEDISEIKAQLETFSVYSQAIASLEDKIVLLSDRVLALENGAVVNPEDPEDPDHQHAYTFIRTVPATCTAKGYDLYYCSCGAEERRNETEMLEHIWSYYQDPSAGETGWSRRCTICGTTETDVVYGCTDGGDHVWVEDGIIEATCDAPGYQKYKCSLCTETKKEANEQPLGHDHQLLSTIPATCDIPEKLIYKCSRCEHGYEAVGVAALGHDWSDAIYDADGYYEPTCTEHGVAGFVCKTCGIEESRTIPPLQHAYEDEVIAPTCAKSGYTLRKCTRESCGYEFVVPGSQTQPTGEHDWGDPVDSGNGYVYTCKVCGATKLTTEENCPGHTDELGETVDATCEAGGYSTYICSLCGRVEESDHTDPLGHSWSGWTTDIEPTCTSEGVEKRTCTRQDCDAVETDTVEALGHSWSGWTTTLKPTCEDDGIERRTCSRCKKSEDRPIEATGHNTTFVKGVPATCTTSGSEDRNVCDTCGNVSGGNAYVAPLGHKYTTTTVAATCTTGGYTLHTCTRSGCGHSYISDETDPNGHNFSAGWVVHKAATCTEPGVKRRYCANCDYYEADSIDATGHSYTSKVVSATCTSGGYTIRTCSDCGRSYTTNETDPNGHNFAGGWQTVTPATCTNAGSEKRVCNTCGHTETRTTSALGHNYGSPYPDNSMSSGYAAKCGICGDIKEA